MGSKRKRDGICTYCGRYGVMTRDHVIPKSVFVELDPIMLVVPACERCQQEKSKGERDLRHYVNLDYSGARHPDAHAQWQKMLSDEATRKWFRDALRRAETVPALSGSGIYLGQQVKVPFNGERMMRTVEFIVRGLFRCETGRMLPPSVPVDVSVFQWHERDMVYRGILGNPPYPISRTKGNDVILWTPILLQGEPTPTTSAWLLAFNHRVLFLGITGGDDLEKFAPDRLIVPSSETLT